MNSRLFKPFLNVFLLAVAMLLFGQGCSNSNLFFVNTKSAETSNSSGTGNGNGTTYDGKLVFYDLVPDFKCEDKPAPKSIITRDNDVWTRTDNTPEKCNATSTTLSNVDYSPSSNFLELNGVTYSLNAGQNTTSTLREFSVVQTAVATSPDAHPGNDICADADGYCSLKAAFDEVNSKNIPAIIKIAIGGYTIHAMLEVTIQSTVMIQGASSTGTVISGNATNLLSTGDLSTKYSSRIIKNIGFMNGNGPTSNSAALKLSGSVHIISSSFNKSAIYAGVNSHDILIEDSKMSQSNVMYGLSAYQSASLKVRRSEFFNNSEGLTVSSVPVVSIQDSSIYDNSATGLRVDLCNTSCQLENTTISNNGGTQFITQQLASGPDLIIRNATIVGSPTSGTTFVSNKHSGISRILLQNSIVKGSPACYFTSTGNNAIVGQSSIVNDSSCGSSGINIAEANLQTIAMNGGPTPTMLPSAGSPALDSGDNSLCTPLDQRGLPRPVDFLGGGAICDIGAVEVQ